MPHVRTASLPSHAFSDYGAGSANCTLTPSSLSHATSGALAIDPFPRTTWARTPDPIEDLNVIIPIGGIGSRFQQEGYRFPKPLINIVGKPMLCWLIERLSLRQTDTLWIAINDKVDDEFQIGQLMRKYFPKLKIQLLRLVHMTKGSTETLFIVTQSMPPECLGRRTVSLDCDTIYFGDVLTKIREMPRQHGACFYFPDTGTEPLFSYIKTSTNACGHEIIHDIQEKKAISRKANSGAYVFPSARILKDWAAAVLDSKLDPEDDKVGEYYTSQMIEMMILSGKVPFMGIPITQEDFSCVGTPGQLRDFLRRVRDQGSQVPSKKTRFCFDLDMTLVGVPLVPGDYSTCPPLWKNIELVRGLYNAGHHIIIYTARRMKTHNGNLGAVIADVGPATWDSLRKYDIPYHDLHFGKPYADIYVDDLAVNANLNTHQELGWIAEDTVREATNQMADIKHAKTAGIVASRDFNFVQIVGEKIRKSSKADSILGEMFFYSHMPDMVRDLFPQIHSITYLPETSLYTITMEKIKGTTYAHLLAGRAMTSGRFFFFLQAIYRLHTSSADCSQSLEVPKELKAIFSERKHATDQTSPAIYDNYSRKLLNRYATYRSDYNALGFEKTSGLLNTLITRLASYESEHRAIFAEVIHGDPVFSNAILDESHRRVRLLDVRAQLGTTLTTAGDIAYDLAKILQSLQGYDHIILASDETLARTDDGKHALDVIVPREDRVLLKELQDKVFWPFVKKQYDGKVRKSDLLDITASLLFSLIPLHREAVRPAFLKMCQNVVEHGMACPI
ncbi:protein phosphatase 2A A subunit [Tothia fuscella]|uniref:Protein phosphatase 2A A subunit n=1 Tax=Tothia fuscella TaxID=1048955 RepID=A0A9P4U3A5_9PEZI|nr:protein phosphatase 2A A subunit [Tothia fuscella]